MDWKIDEIAKLCQAIQRVPAPTGSEHARAQAIAQHLHQMGLTEVQTDDTPNVHARVAGTGGGPGVMMSAHLDTVFPIGTDLTRRQERGRLRGPGIGDNSMGLAGLLTLAQRLAAGNTPPVCDVWFVANAGEEGLGDLKGMRVALDRLGPDLKACIVLEGVTATPWTITHRGLGVRRYRIDVKARGGHSWGSFGEPSAIHLLVGMASAIVGWKVPASPRTTFNIGVIEGGTSVNTIAEHASMLLDLRSEDPGELGKLIALAEELVAEAKANADALVTATVVSDRPTGEIPIDHPLMIAAMRILNDLGVAPGEIHCHIGSTDANIPLSRGIPAVTIYLTEGYDVHESTEWLSLEPLSTGMEQAWRLMQWAIETGSLHPADRGT